jgi:dienelactone hydrolase
MPASVQVTSEDSGNTRHRREINIRTQSGIFFRAAVRFPAGAGPFPAAICLGGLRTGRNVVDRIPPCPLVIAALDYPYHGPRKPSGPELLVQIPEMRRAVLDTPSAAVALLHYVENLPRVDPRRTAVVGVSLGGPFALAAGAAEKRFEAVVVGYACGNLPRWARVNLDQIPWLFRRPLGRLIGELAHPLEPLRYVGTISPRPLLVIASRDDSHVPEEEVARLFDDAREPKTLFWVGGPHVGPRRDDQIGEMVDLVLEWISEDLIWPLSTCGS